VLVAVTPPAGSTVGSARADVSTGRIAGLLRVTTGAQLTHLAASDFAEGFIAAVRRDRAANANTSVAISAGAAGASLRLKLRTAAGADVAGGEVELKLPANGQVTRTLEQLFPSAATEAFDGTLTVRAEGGNIAASVLQIGAAGSVPMALPVIRVQ
jgi:hypothetical protein